MRLFPLVIKVIPQVEGRHLFYDVITKTGMIPKCVCVCVFSLQDHVTVQSRCVAVTSTAKDIATAENTLQLEDLESDVW